MALAQRHLILTGMDDGRKSCKSDISNILSKSSSVRALLDLGLPKVSANIEFIHSGFCLVCKLLNKAISPVFDNKSLMSL